MLVISVILFLFTVYNVAPRVIVADETNFEPLVAFKCGYRNKFLNGSGSWSTDEDVNALCLHGKLDVLKYCRKKYPQRNITNIAKLADFTSIERWCQSGFSGVNDNCDFKFNVQPYMCIAGELKSRLGMIPDGCQFDHAEDRRTCQTFQYWRKKAGLGCQAMLDSDGVSGVIRSFNILQPCGLDFFSAYEYLCCPKTNIIKTKEPNNDGDDSDEDNKNDDDEDNSYEEESEIVTIDAYNITAKKFNDDNKLTGNNQDNKLDEYYRKASLTNEHTRYRDALGRLEQKHKLNVDKVIKEWEKLEGKYELMNKTDSTLAKHFRKKITERYRSAITKLIAITKQERYKLSDVHERRLLAEFHESYRQANASFVKLMNSYVGNSANELLNGTTMNHQPTSSDLLRSAQSLIRLVEKYRARLLNYYRHWLKTGAIRAKQLKPAIIQTLLSNDALVNKNLNMLDNLPNGLTKKVKAAAIDFWQTFREEQTLDVDDSQILWIGDSSNTERVMQFYENLQLGLNSSYSMQTTIPPVVVNHAQIMSSSAVVADNFLLRNQLQQQQIVYKEHVPNEENEEDRRYVNYWLFTVGGLALLTLSTVIISVMKRRIPRARKGFVEVDVCTPEERHVSSMQVNGYSNPTYKYFDQS